MTTVSANEMGMNTETEEDDVPTLTKVLYHTAADIQTCSCCPLFGDHF